MTKQTRNPQETQRKILEAALEEFSANGYHGARIDRIVKAAEVNKRMVYHYFRDKEGLFKALMQSELKKIKEVEESEPKNSLFEISNHWLSNSDKTKDYYRLYLSAEALITNGEITLDEEHQDSFSKSFEVYSNLLKDHHVNPRYFLLAMVSITSMPVVLPQMAKYITGEQSDSREFHEEYAKVLSFLLENKS
ncbi:TetR/AcrR family transcriptional regulator [Vibrio fortis]|uniref:TetR/AcrR family transcriptional regulator n=1 Tax=Vibrio fortis TaxID=212667 RepID=UPI0038CD15BF